MREREIPGPFLAVILDGCVAHNTGEVTGPIGVAKPGTISMVVALLTRGYLVDLCSWRDPALVCAWCHENGFLTWLNAEKLRIRNLIPEGVPIRWICETSQLRNAYETMPFVGSGIQS